MGKKHCLFAAAAPLALACSWIAPSAAAEIKLRVPTGATAPRIKTTVPAAIENQGRIRTVVTPPEDDDDAADETREEASSDDAQSSPVTGIRSRMPTIKTSAPAEVEKGPRIGSRIPASDGDDSVAVDSAESAPSTPRSRTPRIDIPSVPVEIEDAPRIRTRTPATTTNEDDAAEDKPIPRIRIDRTKPAEIEETPSVPRRVPRTRADDSSSIEEAQPRLRTPKEILVPAEIDPTPPKRKRVPVAGDNGIGDIDMPVGVPGTGRIHTIDTAQINCLFRPAKNLTPGGRTDHRNGPGPGILEMVCVTKGKPELVAFRYDVSQGKGNAFIAAREFDEQGYSSKITYEIGRREEGSATRPIYQLVGIERGENNTMYTSCIDRSGSLRHAQDNATESSPGKFISRWCSDGTNISELSFQVTNWFRPATMGALVGISASDPNVKIDNSPKPQIAGVSYEGSTGTTDSGSFLVHSLVGTPGQTPVLCKIVSNTIGSLYCATDPVNDTVTTYLAYSLPEVREHIGKLTQPICTSETKPVFDETSWGYQKAGGQLRKFTRYYDYKVTTCNSPRIAYYLLPGMVRPADRGQFKGACYLASNAFLISEKVVTITYSRAVEATVTGEGFLPDLANPDSSQVINIVEEGQTLSRNGSLDPDRQLMSNGKYAPKAKISNVNAPCL